MDTDRSLTWLEVKGKSGQIARLLDRPRLDNGNRGRAAARVPNHHGRGGQADEGAGGRVAVVHPGLGRGRRRLTSASTGSSLAAPLLEIGCHGRRRIRANAQAEHTRNAILLGNDVLKLDNSIVVGTHESERDAAPINELKNHNFFHG